MSTQSVVDAVKEVDHKAVEVFEEAGLKSDEILNLSREDLEELFPGVINFRRRKILHSRLQELKEEQKDDQSETENQSDFQSSQSSDASTLLYLSDSDRYKTYQERVMSPINERKNNYRETYQGLKRRMSFTMKSSNGKENEENAATKFSDKDNDESHSPKSSYTKANEETTAPMNKRSLLRISSPDYMIYHEPVKSGEITKSVYNRIIRGQINCMMSASFISPFERQPTFLELKEMAKSMVVKYPDMMDPDVGYEKVYQKLKKRLQNAMETKKPQGKMPARSRNRIARSSSPIEASSDGNNLCQETENPLETGSSNSSCYEENSDDNRSNDRIKADDNIQTEEILERHFKTLKKEMEKKKPCDETVHLYLNIEYPRRRKWIMSLPYGHRINPIFETYPCFKNHQEIINEVGRICDFKGNVLKSSVKALTREIDSIIYYGMKLHLPPPKPSTVDKAVYVLRYVSAIFPSKKKSSESDLIVEVKIEDCPQSKIKKDGVYILKHLSDVKIMNGRNVLCELDSSEMIEAIVALIGLFYMADMDYPRSSEIAFTILQFILFLDQKTPRDLLKTVDYEWRKYQKFKCPEEKEHLVSFKSNLQ